MFGLNGDRKSVCLRLLQEPGHFAVARHFNDAESRHLLRLDRQRRQRHIRARIQMLPQHLAVVHLVDVVAGKDQHMLRLLRPDRIDVLVHRVGRAHVPVRAHPLHRRQNLDELAQFLRHNAGPAFADVPVQRQRLVLRQDVHPTQIGVDAVGKGDVDDAVLPAKGNRRLGPITRQRKKPFARSARQKYAQSIFHRHDRLSRLLPELLPSLRYRRPGSQAGPRWRSR